MRLVQALTPADRVKRRDFCEEMQLKMDENDLVERLIFCDEATFHISGKVNVHNVLQQRWIGRAAKGDNHLLLWPPRSPDLTLCDFFLWEFVKDSVYVPPLSMSLKELRDRITHALQTITADMLHRIWDEFDYHLDVCRVTQGAHIEGL